VRRGTRISILLALVLAGGCRPDSKPLGDGVGLRAAIAPDSAGLGDRVVLRIEAVLPKGARPQLPGDADSLGGWRKLGAGEVVRSASGANERWTREVTVAAYRLGAVGPESLRVRGVDARGESLRLACPAPRLTIGGSIAAGEPVDPSRARDIRGVVSTGMPLWPWFAGGALLLAACGFLGARLLDRRRRRRAAEAPVISGPTPEEEFERAIALLLASGILEQGLYREFYYEVSGAVRLYLERVHGLPLLESTSTEVMDWIGGRLSSANERAALRDWLAEGDLVKYARMERLQAEARNYLERSRDLVRQLARGTAVSSEASSTGGAA
jgi:hypothetical protein